MRRANQEIRDYAAKRGVYLWEIAVELDISEPTMTRMMRIELPEDVKQEMKRLIDKIAIENMLDE